MEPANPGSGPSLPAAETADFTAKESNLLRLLFGEFTIKRLRYCHLLVLEKSGVKTPK